MLLQKKTYLYFFHDIEKGRNQGRVTEALTYMTSPQHCSAGGDDRQHVDRVAKGNIKGGVKGTCVLLHIRGNVVCDKLFKIRIGNLKIHYFVKG